MAQRKNPYAFTSKKMEAQYQELRSRFRLTRKEFEEMYIGVRKVNKKGQNMKRYKDALHRPHFSTEVGFIKTRAEFNARMRSISEVLGKSYKQNINNAYRGQFYANLSYVYGQSAEILIQRFMLLTDAEMVYFLDQNKDLEIVYYDSNSANVAAYLATISMTLAKFIERYENTFVK